MATICRIEDSEGNGAYNVCADWGDETPYNLVGAHPGPYDDSALRDRWQELWLKNDHQQYSFGFRDEAQMRAWFYRDEWLQALKAVGCRFTVWEVPSEFVHFGNCQAIFKKSEARLVSSTDLI